MLSAYSLDGAYADCYTTELASNVTFPEFVFAFYTTFLFKLERFILKWMVSKHSTDLQVKQLANGDLEKFAAWHVEDRKENELLMCDFLGHTRSWLMTVPVNNSRTRLYFGSAVVPIRNSKMGKPAIGFGFQALLAFHKVYSVLLLYSARLRIIGQHSKAS
jgi:hypothetical protein